MKGRSLILIFLLIIFINISIVSATVDFLYFSGADNILSTQGVQSGASYNDPDSGFYLQFTDQQTFESFQSVNANITGVTFQGGTVDSGVDMNVTVMSGTQVVGYGILGYYLRDDGYYTLYFYRWQTPGWNTTGLSAPIHLTITDCALSFDLVKAYTYYTPSPYGAGTCVIEWSCRNGLVPPGTSVWYETASSYSYYNRYEYLHYDNFNTIEIFRDATNTSKTLLTEGGNVLLNETTFTSTDYFYQSPNISKTLYNIQMENIYGDTKNKNIVFTYDVLPSTGILSFNRSFFTDPEKVGVIYDIENFDITNNEYWILLTGTNGGATYFVTNDFYDITTATGQDNFTISYAPLSLPFQMRAELWTYSKLTGVSSALAYTSWVPYNPASLAPGKIWTAKTSYNVSEIVTINYESAAAQIAINPERTEWADLFYFGNLAPGTGTVKMVFNENHIGTWQLKLQENGIYTNSTSIEILPGLTPYARWGLKDVWNLGYTGYIYVYADDPNASLTVYDGANVETYNITVGSGSQTINVKFYDHFSPGTWTASLLNYGVRYNDTTVVGSSVPIVRFNSTAYETGDTMGISYFIPSTGYKLVLTDANYKEIIKFTTTHGVISSGSFETVPFSLTDNNEYGLFIETGIDSGLYKTGSWYVFVENPDGSLDDNIWDSARVKVGISEPADASNEMIDILFSPEGLFFILTACLTMMGLVTAKHPAGGAAGAVVGVGFGVYFEALPVWLLLLMVIALVVLAGVSVASHFGGK